MKIINIFQTIIIGIQLWFVPESLAQYYYLNSYNSGSDGEMANIIYKIDVENSIISDSLFLNIAGDYVFAMPLRLRQNNSHFLVCMMINGLSGKNSSARENFVTYYAVIEETPFQVMVQDSLPNIYIYNKFRNYGDSLSVDWLDENFPDGHFYGIFSLGRNDFRLHINHRRDYREINEPPNIIGDYLDPTLIYSDRNSRYYWGYYNGTSIILFKTNYANDIIQSLLVGNKSECSILLGYVSGVNKIYTFKTRYSLTTYSPPITSPDSIFNHVDLINPDDFSVSSSVMLRQEPNILSNEIGTADNIDSKLVYYYSKSEDYRIYQPAYLLIFDTRTNEATWLRVGWR